MLPAKGRPAAEVLAELRALRAEDQAFASGRVLGSMCTAPHPVAVQAYQMFLETNLGDPAWCRGAQEAERRALASILGLLHAPGGSDGLLVSGGAEANLTALRIARRSGLREVILPRTAHFSFLKACDLLDMEPRWAELDGQFRVDVGSVEAQLGPNTACIVGIAGTTELGTVDPIRELGALALEHAAHLHVDAAFGGFALPFLPGAPGFDFALAGVDSLTIDPHKMGMAPIPAGCLAVRTAEMLRRISVPTPYVSTEAQASLVGTRPGAAAAATHAVLQHLGEAGYHEVAQRCMATARLLAKRLREAGLPPVLEPVLPVLAVPVPKPEPVRAALAKQGWFVSLAPLTRGIKVVCMPHVRPEHVEAFVPALRAAVQEVQ
ncbi:MAG: tyrosine decarboxylase MfnA [Halobacteriales archaeon]|nr:tyrosine decarboxylase MfnA [Halobacteriales archaeon]